MNKVQLQQKFVEMIDTFRLESETLSSEEKKHLLDWFGRPCQIFILSCTEYNLHMIIKTNFTELRDKIVEVIEITPENFENKLHDFTNRRIWKKEIEEKDEEFYFIPKTKQIDIIRNILVYFGEKIRQRRLDIQSKLNWFSGDTSFGYWDFVGDIDTIDLNEKVKGIVQGTKQSTKISKVNKAEVQPPLTTPYKVSACGAYFYPLVLIGKFKKTLKGQLSGADYQQLDDFIYDDNFGNVRLAVTKAGLVGIEIENVVKANKIINTIFGTALLLGLPVQTNRPIELAFVHLKERAFISSWSDSSVRTMMYDYRTRFMRLNLPRTQISVGILRQIIKKAERVWQSKLDEEVRLLLESFTYANSDELLQSFNTAWLIIEKYLRSLWYKKIVKKSSEEKTKDWDVHEILKRLKLKGIITSNEYSKIIRIIS